MGNSELADGPRRAPEDHPTLVATRRTAANRCDSILSALQEAPLGVGQELQSTESKSKESSERIEDIPTVKEGKDHE
jgi:hypothetical protein